MSSKQIQPIAATNVLDPGLPFFREKLPLTLRQAVIYLGVSPQTVYLWVERKQISHLAVKGLFRPHYLTWSEQRKIEIHAPEYLRNIVGKRVRVYKKLMAMNQEPLDLENAVVWNLRFQNTERSGGGVADVRRSRDVSRSASPDSVQSVSVSYGIRAGTRKMFKTVWSATLARAKIRAAGTGSEDGRQLAVYLSTCCLGANNSWIAWSWPFGDSWNSYRGSP